MDVTDLMQKHRWLWYHFSFLLKWPLFHCLLVMCVFLFDTGLKHRLFVFRALTVSQQSKTCWFSFTGGTAQLHFSWTLEVILIGQWFTLQQQRLQIQMSIVWFLTMSLSHSFFLQFKDWAGATKSRKGTGTYLLTHYHWREMSQNIMPTCILS